MKTHPIPQSTQKATTLKALLVGVEITGSSPLGHSLDELDGLARTAHYTPVATFTQRLATINSKTFIGKGEFQEGAEDYSGLERGLMKLMFTKEFSVRAVVFASPGTPFKIAIDGWHLPFSK